MGWAFLAMVFINQCFNFLVIARKYPDLVAERSGIGEGAKKWDVPLASLMGVWLPISTLFVAGLDNRLIPGIW